MWLNQSLDQWLWRIMSQKPQLSPYISIQTIPYMWCRGGCECSSLVAAYVQMKNIATSLSIYPPPVLRWHSLVLGQRQPWFPVVWATHTHLGRQLAANDLDEIDLAAGQITECAVRPGLVRFSIDSASSSVFNQLFIHTTFVGGGRRTNQAVKRQEQQAAEWRRRFPACTGYDRVSHPFTHKLMISFRFINIQDLM